MHPDNHSVWALWQALDTQWRVVVGKSAVAWQGLDYAAADVARRALGIRKRRWREVFEQLQEMERSALGLLNAQPVSQP